MAEYDLTQKIAGFLDVHLILPLLKFLLSENIQNREAVMRAQLAIIQKTNLVDYEKELLKHLNQEIPESLTAKRKEVVETVKKYDTWPQEHPLMSLLTTPDFVNNLKNEKNFNLDYLSKNHNITRENVQDLFSLAKFSYECGNYAGSVDLLGFHLTLLPDSEKRLDALWGKLAAEILSGDRWQEAKTDLDLLREEIDTKQFASPVEQLQYRTWLIHWSLFVLFNYKGREIVEWLITEKYLNAIQTSCPHVLRYLTAILILNKRKGSHWKELVKVIQQESSYRDPITEFVEALYVNYDFEDAQVKLRECETVLQNDYFLNSKKVEFFENARLLIFETYCRIHQCVDIGMLAQKLNLEQEAAEKWIVNLIRNAKLDAKIDSKANTVVMGVVNPSIYQQVIEKTKQLSLRVNTGQKRQNLTSSGFLNNSLSASVGDQTVEVSEY